jgi:tellurite resistance protein
MPQICLFSPRKKNKIFMISFFNDLSAKDQAILADAPILVAIWVGISDNHFDQNEQLKAVQTLNVKSFSESPDIAAVYNSIENPTQALTSVLDTLPKEVEAIKMEVKERLQSVKEVLSKLEPVFANDLYKSFRSVGVHVANASGGMLGLGSMSEDEKIALQLDFMKPN